MKLGFLSSTRRVSGKAREDHQDGARAWVSAWTLGWTEMVSWGILYYAFSVLLVPMQEELGWSAGLITGAYSLALLVSGLCAPWVGRWVDQHGARWVMTVGSVLGALLMLAWARVDSWPVYYLIWIGIGIAMSAVLYEPAFATVAQWFGKGRGRAMLIITFFGGLASTVFLPLTGWLEVEFGWRNTLLILAGVLAVNTILPHAVVLRSPPNPVPRTRDSMFSRWGSLLRDTWFQRVSLAFFLQAFVTAGVSVHMIAYLLDHGISPTTAAGVAGSIGLFQTGARVLLTMFERALPPETMTAIMLASQMVAILLLVFIPQGAALYISAGILGIGRGALTLLRPALLLTRYQVHEFGSVSGSMALLLTFAGAAAPVLSGVAVTWIGAYEAIFVTFGIASLVAAVILWSTRFVPAPAIPNAP